MRYLKLTLSYDGTHYAGWQIQDGQPTLQGTLQHVLKRITGVSERIIASGRTDAGVHAWGQVASWKTGCLLDAAVLLRAINAYLPRDMRLLACQDAHEGFHALRDALSKRYRYVIQDARIHDVFDRGYCWFIPTSLDEGSMQRAARSLVGEHDFAAYQTAGSARRSTVRTVYAIDVARQHGEHGSRVVIEIEANGFLYNMVRNIVGTLVEIGRHRQDEQWPKRVLVAGDRRLAGMTAPAHGLYLLRVHYAGD